MANKFIPKASKAGSDKFPQKGPHNPNVGTSGKGRIAPKPSTGQPLLAQTKGSGPSTAGIARVKSAGTAPAGAQGGPPINNAFHGQKGNAIGQPDPHSFNPPGPGSYKAPVTSGSVVRNALATSKPSKRKNPAPFYGEF